MNETFFSFRYLERSGEPIALSSRWEAVGASYPFERDGKIWYKTAYANPYPEKEIVEIQYASNVLKP